MTLSKELKGLFTDREKNKEMMHGDCSVNPTYPYGYGKELEDMGVSYQIEDQYGGEDCGSTYYCIWSFAKGGTVCYFQFDGWYQSYHGAEFEDVIEVVPYETKVVKYARV